MPAVNFGFSALHSTCQIKGYKVFCVYQCHTVVPLYTYMHVACKTVTSHIKLFGKELDLTGFSLVGTGGSGGVATAI